jgi:hypothetical protein
VKRFQTHRYNMILYVNLDTKQKQSIFMGDTKCVIPFDVWIILTQLT